MLEGTADELLCPARDDRSRAANVLDIEPMLASRSNPLSNMTTNPSNRRDLELKQFEFEALFMVRFTTDVSR